jgi:hypothetical protein
MSGCHWIRCLGTKRRHRDVFSVGLVQLVGSGNEFSKVEGDVLPELVSLLVRSLIDTFMKALAWRHVALGSPTG